MLILYRDMIFAMESVLELVEKQVPAPKTVLIDGQKAWRYEEQSLNQALVLKSVLIISTLKASYILSQRGQYMQQAMLHRVVDEAQEDVTFLGLALLNNDYTQSHKDYLDYFWQEESGPPTKSHQYVNRPTVSRKKIRAYIANNDGTPNPSGGIGASKAISGLYSGFVHGASSHIMECYLGSPPRFHTDTLLHTTRAAEHIDDYWNPVYRGFIAHILIAKVFRNEDIVAQLMRKKLEFEREFGVDYSCQ